MTLAGSTSCYIWFMTRTKEFRITPTSIHFVGGLLARDSEDVSLTEVAHLSVKQSFVQKILGYGSIRVTFLGPSGATRILTGLEKPTETKARIWQMCRNARINDGLPPDVSQAPKPVVERKVQAKCIACKHPLIEGARFCGMCGADAKTGIIPKQKPSLRNPNGNDAMMPPDSRFRCPHCGALLLSGMFVCVACHTDIRTGRPVRETSSRQAVEEESGCLLWAAYIFAIFMPAIGIILGIVVAVRARQVVHGILAIVIGIAAIIFWIQFMEGFWLGFWLAFMDAIGTG